MSGAVIDSGGGPPPNADGGSPPPISAPSPGTGSGISTPWASEWIQPDFTLNHKALDRLPDHLKGLRPTLERQKNFEGVLQALDHSQTLAGKKALAPLDANAPAQAVAERKALLDTINGVPPSAKDYGIAKPADFPDAQWDPKLAESFTAWAHKHSVSPAAAKELLGLQVGNVKTQLANQAQYEQTFWADEQKNFEATIQRDNIPAARASALVEKGAISLGLDLNNERTKTFLKGSEARLMAMRHAIAIGEDTALTGDGSSPGEGTNYAELAQSARQDPANPIYAQYWNKDGKFSQSVQAAAVAKVNGWLQLAEGKSQKAQAGGRR